jgi:ribosomal protein L22
MARAATKDEQAVTVRAHAKYVRTSARKAQMVCVHIRGKTVPEARAVLAFTPRAAARDWSKLLESAIANAEHNHELIGDELRVAEAYADQGPTLKRFRPRAMGRATRIRKRTSHLTIGLTPVETLASPGRKRAAKPDAEKETAKKPAAKAPAAKKPPAKAPAAKDEPKSAAATPAAEEKPKRGRAKADADKPAKPSRRRARKTAKTEEEADE